VGLGVFPISIDVDKFAGASEGEPARIMAKPITKELTSARADAGSHVVILGVERLEYTKGLIQKPRAFRQTLRRHPERQGNVTLVQLVAPSREEIQGHASLKNQIDRLVGEISGEFNRVGWSPIRYDYGRWNRNELVAHYRAARVALVKPLQDGMNLVAKESCAASTDDDGVLILSEHAGAAAQLHADALLVKPYDEDQFASAIHRACTMGPGERKARMRRMGEAIRRQDIHWWAESILGSIRDGAGRSASRRTRYDRRPPLPGPSFRAVGQR